jgi:hypothetical protein
MFLILWRLKAVSSLFGVKCPRFLAFPIIFHFLFLWLSLDCSAWHILLFQETSNAEPLLVTTGNNERYKCLLPHFQEKEKVGLHLVL